MDAVTLDRYMGEALLEAARAERLGEVPVGAVVVRDGTILGRGCNEPIRRQDPTAHAEIVALREAARTAGNYRLTDAWLFVTVEPCLMCAAACLHARIHTLVFGARDEKTGAVRSRYRILEDPAPSHRIEVIEGAMAEECARRIRTFFRSRRG